MNIRSSILRRQCAPQIFELDCSLFAWSLSLQNWSLRRNTSSANTIEYSKSRKLYEKSLSDLRKEWSKEVEEKKRVAAENQAAKAREIEERRHQRAPGMSVSKDREVDLRLRREEERRETMAVKAARRAESVQRESVRQGILESMREERKINLLEQSRHWIGTEEELIKAVDRAVEKVEPLYVSKKVSKRMD